MEVLGIVGARAGSRGLPQKNVRLLDGVPLLAHAIRIATECHLVNRVLLSTDSEAYAEIGRQFGADTPFLRPAEHATDTAIEFGFIKHALEWLAEHEGYRPDVVARISPTAPLIRHSDVDRCIEIVRDHPDADSAIIMTEAREHPRKVVKISPDGQHVVSYMTDRGVDVSPSNRQGYVAAFNRQSLPVVSRSRTILELGTQTGERVRYHIVPPETAIDIDTGLDLVIVEMMLAARRSDMIGAPRSAPDASR